MRNKVLISFLLFICLTLFVSCNNAYRLYSKGNYVKALEKLSLKDNLNKDDYLIKIKALNALGRSEEAKESVLLYLFMASEEDERELPVKLFIDFEFTDALNVLLLKLTDGFTAQSVIFKSLYNLKQFDRAKQVLTEYIAENLSIEEYLSVLIKYPIDNEYTLGFFESWFNIISDEETDTFITLFNEYLNLDLSDECLSECKVFLEKISESNNYRILKELKYGN